MYKNDINKNNINNNKVFENDMNQIEGFKNIIEAFDGIRKDNSRIIFGILLSIITIDIIIDCFNL